MKPQIWSCEISFAPLCHDERASPSLFDGVYDKAYDLLRVVGGEAIAFCKE